jgi:hypothetical protein
MPSQLRYSDSGGWCIVDCGQALRPTGLNPEVAVDGAFGRTEISQHRARSGVNNRAYFGGLLPAEGWIKIGQEGCALGRARFSELPNVVTVRGQA